MNKLPFLFLLPLFLFTACSNDPYYKEDDFQEVPKIDVHVHIRTERDVFVQQAIKDNFKLVNIVVDGASTWAGIENQFEFAILQQNAYPDQLRTINAFSVEGFDRPGWNEKVLRWLEGGFKQGAIGIKVWKNIGMVLKDTMELNVMLDDPRFDEIFDYLEDNNRIVVGHLGEPLNCWLPLEEMTTNNDRSYFKNNPQYHMYLHPELPSYQDQMDARDKRLDKHSDLTFMGAHMASIEWNVDTLGAWLDRYPNATVDLAARMGQVFWQTQQDREKVRQFFIDYQDRLLYGTDLGDNGSADPKSLTKNLQETWQRDWKYFVSDQEMKSDLVDGSFQGIRLPIEVVDKLYYKNAAGVFGF